MSAATFVMIIFGLLVAFGLIWYTLRPASTRETILGRENSLRAELEEELETLYRQLRELEVAREAQELDGTDYERIKLRDETRAALILERLDALPPNPEAKSAHHSVLRSALVALTIVAIGTAFAYRFFIPGLQQLALHPDEVQAIEGRKKIDELEAKLQAEAQSDPSRVPTTKTLLEYAEAAWKAQDYDRAATAYTTLLRRDPLQPTAVRRYGTLLFFAGRNDEALELLDLAIKLEPNEAETYLTKGNLLFAQNNPAGAIEAWQGYIRLRPDAARVRDLIASAQAQLEANDKGRRIFAQNCAGCHGSEGQGIVGPKLKSNPKLIDMNFVRAQVRQGRGGMPPFDAEKLSDAELDELTQFLARGFSGK